MRGSQKFWTVLRHWMDDWRECAHSAYEDVKISRELLQESVPRPCWIQYSKIRTERTWKLSWHDPTELQLPGSKNDKNVKDIVSLLLLGLCWSSVRPQVSAKSVLSHAVDLRQSHGTESDFQPWTALGPVSLLLLHSLVWILPLGFAQNVTRAWNHGISACYLWVQYISIIFSILSAIIVPSQAFQMNLSTAKFHACTICGDWESWSKLWCGCKEGFTQPLAHFRVQICMMPCWFWHRLGSQSSIGSSGQFGKKIWILPWLYTSNHQIDL